MINDKMFEHRPIAELMAIVRQDLRKLDDQGLIDEGTVIKTVMACNDRLGIPIREVKQVCIPVNENRAKLPLNFEKLYFVTAIMATNTMIHGLRNPFNNNFDRDILYEAELDRGSLGNVESYGVTIKRTENVTVHNMQNFVTLEVDKNSYTYCHPSCPNMRKPGKYSVRIKDGYIETPFRSGEIYIMYLGTMQDEMGNILFPFHPLITPYYEWSVKEKVIMDVIYNSDGDYANLLKLTQAERVKAWLDAYNITTDRAFGEYVNLQRKKELGWYNQYFKFFQ